jgi:hypothetical protein
VRLCEPLVPSLPLHAPLAAHDVAPVEDQVRVELEPSVTLVGSTEMVTEGNAFVVDGAEPGPPQAV